MSRITSKGLIRKYKYYNAKIDKLWSKRQRIESLLYMSILIEFFVKEAISTFEKIIEGSAIEHHVYFNPRNLYNREDIENQPLGYLIRVLNTYTKDKNLIDKLNEFSKTRNKCIHKLLENEEKDIKKELRTFDNFYYNLLTRLIELNVNQMNLVEKHFCHMCDDCFKKMIPKQVKL